MNERLISEQEISDRQMLQLLSRQEIKGKNKLLLESIYLTCKGEYDEAHELLEMTEYNHPDWQINNYMAGYHKGRLRMIEYLRTAIQ